MELDKKSIGQIKTIVEGVVEKSEARINKKIDGVETSLNKKIDGVETGLNDKIDGVETRLNTKIDNVENRIVSVISREVNDLADINRTVIGEVDKIDILEKRLRRVEHKIGIVS